MQRRFPEAAPKKSSPFSGDYLANKGHGVSAIFGAFDLQEPLLTRWHYLFLVRGDMRRDP